MASRKEHYCASCVLGFSVTQIMFGVISISLHVVLLVGHTVLSPVGHGIWAGIFFIITGILGIASSQKKDPCTITAFLVMAILAAVIASCGLITTAAIEVAVYSNYRNPFHRILFSQPTVLAISAIMVVIGVIQGIFAIVSSGLACHGLCGGDDSQYDNRPVQYVPGAHQQMAFAPTNPQGHGGYNPNYPPNQHGPQHGHPHQDRRY